MNASESRDGCHWVPLDWFAAAVDSGSPFFGITISTCIEQRFLIPLDFFDGNIPGPEGLLVHEIVVYAFKVPTDPTSGTASIAPAPSTDMVKSLEQRVGDLKAEKARVTKTCATLKSTTPPICSIAASTPISPSTVALNNALKLARHVFTNATTRSNQLVKEREDLEKTVSCFRDLKVHLGEQHTKLQDVSKRSQLLEERNAGKFKELETALALAAEKYCVVNDAEEALAPCSREVRQNLAALLERVRVSLANGYYQLE